MSTKDLIERLRTENRDSVFPELCAEAADELERLTQPVGVEPVSRVLTVYFSEETSNVISNALPCETFLYSAETVARLIAERDATAEDRDTYKQCAAKLVIERDALREQVKMLREAIDDAIICMEWDGMDATKQREALAATEPKEKAA